MTLNLSISVYSRVRLKARKDKVVSIDLKDLNKSLKFESLEAALAATDPEMKLVQTVLAHFRPKSGFDLETSSESPVGAGLGGSSSLYVSLIKAFLKLQKKAASLEKIVHLAHNLEGRMLGTPTGIQDYVPAIDPGFYCLHLRDDRYRFERLKVDKRFLREHFTLIYTGRAHHSGMNNWSVIKSAVEKDSSTLEGLQRLATVAQGVRDAIVKSKWDQLSGLFREETEIRLRLAPAFLSPEIEQLKTFAASLPGAALKVCGAGGGGCVFIWSKEKAAIREFCEAQGFRILPAEPVV